MRKLHPCPELTHLPKDRSSPQGPAIQRARLIRQVSWGSTGVWHPTAISQPLSNGYCLPLGLPTRHEW